MFLSRWVLSFPASLPALHPVHAEYLPRYRLTTWARRWLSMRSCDAVPVGISGGAVEFSRGVRGLNSSFFALIRAARSLSIRLFLFTLARWAAGGRSAGPVVGGVKIMLACLMVIVYMPA